jgi:hypothetical protein
MRKFKVVLLNIAGMESEITVTADKMLVDYDGGGLKFMDSDDKLIAVFACGRWSNARLAED